MKYLLGSDTPLLVGSFARASKESGWAQVIRLRDGLTTVGLDCGIPMPELALKLRNFGNRPFLDYLALTHFHNDHFHRRTVQDLVTDGSTKLCLPSCYSMESRGRLLRRTLFRKGRRFTPRLFGEKDGLTFAAHELSLRTLAARHNGDSGLSHVIVLDHHGAQLVYVTDVAQVPAELYRLNPDVCIMEMNHPPAMKPVTERSVRLARNRPLNAGAANHLSNLDVLTYLRNRRFLNLHIQKEDHLKLFVAMHLGPGNTKLEVLQTLASAFVHYPRRPLLAIRGKEKVYVAWIQGDLFGEHSPEILLWAFDEPVFGVYPQEIRVWEKGPVNGPSTAEEYALRFRIDTYPEKIFRRLPDAGYAIAFRGNQSVRLSALGSSMLDTELYLELECIKRKARRAQAFSAIV